MTNVEHWRRDAPTFYNFLALERSALEAQDVLDGLTSALMSRDKKSDAQTYMVEIPPGWRANADGRHASLEFFLLQGDMALNAEVVGAGGYIHVPQLCGGGELSSQNGAKALAFWNPNIPAFPYPYTRNRLLKTHDLDWMNSMPGAHGVMHKSLRLPDPPALNPAEHPQSEGFDGGPGGYLRFQYIAPNMIAEAEHVHHECWEEIIVLQGDVMLINEGQMGIGSVVGHPQEWYHAPFVSRSGAVILVHTDAPMGFPWPPRDYPDARKLCSCYLDQSRWDIPAEHIPWEDHPLRAEQDASKDYQAWRKSGKGPLWGDDDPGKRVPYRPGKQGTATTFRSQWTRTGEDE